MALTKDGIFEGNSKLSRIQTCIDRALDNVGDAMIGLKNDSNYQIFISGTEIGKELNEKLETLIGLIKNLTENELQNIMKISNQFLEIQRDLNK